MFLLFLVPFYVHFVKSSFIIWKSINGGRSYLITERSVRISIKSFGPVQHTFVTAFVFIMSATIRLSKINY